MAYELGNAWLSATGTLAPTDTMAQAGQGMVLGIQSIRLEAMVGIISGLIGATITDHFYNLQLPIAFTFFSGKNMFQLSPAEYL
jgi:PTS system maltose and glucose-specific IIC component